jgi:hypothetical protein
MSCLLPYKFIAYRTELYDYDCAYLDKNPIESFPSVELRMEKVTAQTDIGVICDIICIDAGYYEGMLEGIYENLHMK